MYDIKIFGLGESNSYAKDVCKYFSNPHFSQGRVQSVELSRHKEDFHDDGEPYVFSSENVRGCDVFIISSLYTDENQSVSEKFFKSLLFARSIRDASARRITMIFPYLAFQRQDRKTESRAPVYTKYIPEMLESLLRPDDRVLTIDSHNLSAYQSGFRLMLDHLEAKPIFSSWFGYGNAKKVFPDLDFSNLSFVSPDDGGLERVGFYRKKLQTVLNQNIDTACVYKTHEGTKIEAHGVMGDVKGKDVFIIDDMISSGKTLVQATNAITAVGGRVRGVFCTHGLFVGSANDNIAELIRRGVKIITTDTIHTNKLTEENRKGIISLSTTNLIAEAIVCIHNESSVSNLLV